MNQAEEIKTTCCFFGHREINETEEIKQQVYAAVEKLILDYNVDTFLFGSKSRFNSLCYEQVTKIKEKYPHIKRIYVRAEFPEIDEAYRAYLLENYEDTYYPERVVGAGRAVYVKRNCAMIEGSRFCIAYCKEGLFIGKPEKRDKTGAYLCNQEKQRNHCITEASRSRYSKKKRGILSELFFR